jgi:redox-sensitive bicupin YhaK (pirin superfamily)
MGNGRIIKAGEAQYMSAGSGVMHSEFNPKSDEAAHLLQIWIQPDKKGVKPRYDERSFVAAEPGKWQLVTSKAGRDGSIAIHQDAELWLAKLEPSQKIAHTVAPKRHGWLHVAEGKVNLNGQTLSGGDAAAVDGQSALELSALDRSQVLLFDLN